MKRVIVLSLLIGCKYGGSEEDPLAGLEPGRTVDVDMLDGATADEEPMPMAPTSPVGAGGRDGGKAPAGAGGKDAGRVPPTGPTKPTAPANACAPTIATCDPVRNTGCPPLMQCDIDTGATSATGRCVFFMNPDGGQCTASFVSVGCAAQNTCVAGACRKICYCDSDCPNGQSCSDASGPGPAGAFKLCQ